MIIVEPVKDMQDVYSFLQRMHQAVVKPQLVEKQL